MKTFLTFFIQYLSSLSFSTIRMGEGWQLLRSTTPGNLISFLFFYPGYSLDFYFKIIFLVNWLFATKLQVYGADGFTVIDSTSVSLVDVTIFSVPGMGAFFGDSTDLTLRLICLSPLESLNLWEKVSLLENCLLYVNITFFHILLPDVFPSRGYPRLQCQPLQMRLISVSALVNTAWYLHFNNMLYYD